MDGSTLQKREHNGNTVTVVTSRTLSRKTQKGIHSFEVLTYSDDAREVTTVTRIPYPMQPLRTACAGAEAFHARARRSLRAGAGEIL
jgi:hypothetical protein